MKWSYQKAASLFVLLVLAGRMPLHAQLNLPKYEFGINLGFMVYQGDLTPKRFGSFETQKLTLGLHASKIVNPVLSLRGSLVIGKLKGDDAVYDNPEYRQQRNFNFRSPVTELTGQMVWNLSGANYLEKGLSPYVFAGAGLSLIKVRRDWSGINSNYFTHESPVWQGLAIDSAHHTPRIIPVFPVGAGIKYFFHPNWGVNTEAAYRLITTDYLDGFSQAANPDRKDKYLTYTVGVIYRGGKKNLLKCPKLKY